MTEMRSFRVCGILSVCVALCLKVHEVHHNDDSFVKRMLLKNLGSANCNGKIGICTSFSWHTCNGISVTDRVFALMSL
jgi:hypothetical protein